VDRRESISSYDLHTHSTCSDGVYAPEEVVARAAAAGVTCLALTDHDETAGVDAARKRAIEERVEFIAGVEISVSWREHTLHVIGLQVDPDNTELSTGLARVRAGRDERARRIARELERAGIGGSLEGARRRAANPRLIGRAHFARYLVDAGYVADFGGAFRLWLGSGAPGYVAHRWAGLEEAMRWISASGGLAVLAHPARYKLRSCQRDEFLAVFRDLGGVGVEVVSGNHTRDEAAGWARHAKRFGLLASAGSDFHGPVGGLDPIGRLPQLPLGCAPVWTKF
jgi:predicted metal-dependent phosphoesterase TrpH